VCRARPEAQQRTEDREKGKEVKRIEKSMEGVRDRRRPVSLLSLRTETSQSIS
jgi:hypothetical protein